MKTAAISNEWCYEVLIGKNGQEEKVRKKAKEALLGLLRSRGTC